MALMISVSGIRGIVGEDLTPNNLVSYAQAFAAWASGKHSGKGRPKIVIGRDTRPSGVHISSFVVETLALSGVDVIDLGIATTPTVELAVTENAADAGIIVTASHNPIEWNALKLLNRSGEFLNPDELADFISITESGSSVPARWDALGSTIIDQSADKMHIGKILSLPFVDTTVIEAAGLSVLIDAVEGAGSVIVPELCKQLGIYRVETHDCGGTGLFPRNPEPIIDNLSGTIDRMKASGCDFGIIVDPDVDRLALIQEDGVLFGEEYTLVACADYYLRKDPGVVVNNLSSSRALRDIAARYGQNCVSATVGEANVVSVMKEKHATIGGEGNGGVILPSLHYGRDALVGIAIFVQAFAEWRNGCTGDDEKTLSAFRKTFPSYFMAKKKMELSISKKELAGLFAEIVRSHPDAVPDTRDGLKLDFPEYWVHLRASNTEPIIRIYAEARTAQEAEKRADDSMEEIATFFAK